MLLYVCWLHLHSAVHHHRYLDECIWWGSVRLMWLVTKLDVAQTVDSICVKVLHDHSVSHEVLGKRQRALLQLGSIYAAWGKAEDEGLRELTDRMCAQSGAF